MPLLLLGRFSYGQNGKLFFIKDKDTLNVAANNVKVFIEIDNRLIPFNKDEKLVYPDGINLDNINSIIVLYNTDTLSFFNYKEKVKFSRLPLPVVKTLLPIYSGIFSDRRNMYFTIDSYPFENKERKETAGMNQKNSKIPKSKMVITELYYQVTEMYLYEPGKRINRE